MKSSADDIQHIGCIQFDSCCHVSVILGYGSANHGTEKSRVGVGDAGGRSRQEVRSLGHNSTQVGLAVNSGRPREELRMCGRIAEGKVQIHDLCE